MRWNYDPKKIPKRKGIIFLGRWDYPGAPSTVRIIRRAVHQSGFDYVDDQTNAYVAFPDAHCRIPACRERPKDD